ncbi:MAG: acetate--CoA ligase [Bacteroidia bacterium]|nr:acetate--CoA ligase [Bacteroidia bacterium]MDW8159334.1 acetate--CoA ligase [Bacteroidia bacterium]
MKPEITTWQEYQAAYKESIENPSNFWSKIAKTFYWQKEWTNVCSGDFSDVNIRWFDGGILNITENCLDRHLAERGDHLALIWEPNDPTEKMHGVRKYTYRQLYEEVLCCAQMLQKLGVQKGDRVCIYLPMIPEILICMLACARIGAIHSVVFGGFSAASLAERINDSDAHILITADSAFRGNKEIHLKEIADKAIQNAPGIQHCIVYIHTGCAIPWVEGRDLKYQDLIAQTTAECPAVPMEAEAPLFILYTSGSTGKPKGIVHTTAGYMVYVGYTFRNIFQIRDDDIFWCTADVGWITGHSYLVYGPLLNGTTVLMFEGIPTYPDPGRFWQVIQKYKVTIFYTAPTVIRSLLLEGTSYLEDKDLSSLRVLGSVGEPINEEAWQWYYKHVGKERCPIVDTYWQTETGGIVISPIANITPTPPCYATYPLPGIVPAILDSYGKEIALNSLKEPAEGTLCFKQPWPSIARTTFRDHARFKKVYFEEYPGYYLTGDNARYEPTTGMFRITGRMDDVLNVSGHRLGTAEIENAINEHEAVVETAVVGYPHPIKGQGIYAFVICDRPFSSSEDLLKSVQQLVSEKIGPIAKPDYVQVVPGLPKTRSGKIMRRILRKLLEGATPTQIGDTSTLLDPAIVESIFEGLLLKPKAV